MENDLDKNSTQLKQIPFYIAQAILLTSRSSMIYNCVLLTFYRFDWSVTDGF